MNVFLEKKEKRMQWHKVILIFGIAGLFSGCAFYEEPKPANVDLPTLNDAVRVESKWWEAYKDSTLNELVQKALKNNFDLREAAANVSLAHAALSGAQANLYPNISGSAGADRTLSSKESYAGTGKTYNSFTLSGILSYEVDIWGKLKNAKASAQESLLSTKAAKDAIKIGLVSSVVDSYFGLLSLKTQEDIAKKTLKVRKESLKLVEQKHKLGAVSPYEVYLAKSAYTNAKSTLTSIQSAIARQESALHLLIGTSPKELFESKKSFDKKALPQPIGVPEGLSATLLEQRPDIQAALHALEAANLDIKVAKAAYFPSISLSGALGFSSMELSEFITSSARTWNIGSSLVAPLFDFGRIKSQVRSREALQEMARIGFESSVTRAFLEVYEAQEVRKRAYEAKLQALEQVRIYEELAKLAQSRYEAGAGEYQDVLDANDDLLNARINLVQLSQEALSADITLIKALGGGWDESALVTAN
jgi:multidrug efflux system outer membrane protein